MSDQTVHGQGVLAVQPHIRPVEDDYQSIMCSEDEEICDLEYLLLYLAMAWHCIRIRAVLHGWNSLCTSLISHQPLCCKLRISEEYKVLRLRVCSLMIIR